MLHPDYFAEGSNVSLPEVATHLDVADPTFEVLTIHPGGMGVCFRLYHHGTRTSYALKCIRPDLLDDKDSFGRFHEELDVWLTASACSAVAEALAVVRINDIPSVVATWMQGGDLAHALAAFQPANKFEAIVRVTKALQWAKNTLGIIHRDLKPANILLDTSGIAYLSDWGLARPLRSALLTADHSGTTSSTARPERTQAGSFLGTVLYAAPEQLAGSTTIDHRADIYALGCIMYELETGTPPFTGSTFQEIAYKHRHLKAPTLGGLLRRTSLGLEDVVARCLEKSPDSRYCTYDELLHELSAIAATRHFGLERCVISERYKRNRLGKGHVDQDHLIANAPVKGKGVVVLEHKDMAPYLEEASNLMALGRYKEAEVLFAPAYVPEMIQDTTAWTISHSFAEMYAMCLQNMSGRLNEALNIYATLSPTQHKPAEFYVNYSLALLRAGMDRDAKHVCQRGLARWPEDLDILGNYTISLRRSDDLQEAQNVSLKRLALRRDVHSIEEAASVIFSRMLQLRDTDLPQSISLAELHLSLIKEGLALNPRYGPLRIAEIQLYRFVHARDSVLKAAQSMIDDDQIPIAFNQLAFVELVEELSESSHFKKALELIEKHKNITCSSGPERLRFVKYRIYAEKHMIGMTNASGQRMLIPEVVDFFLTKSGETYSYPFMAARILEWMGRGAEAETVLRGNHVGGQGAQKPCKEMAFLLERNGRVTDALCEARALVAAAPWRAENYDVLSYVAGKAGDSILAAEAKKKGEETFDREMKLFDKVRALIV